MHIITYIHIPVSRQILDPKFPRSSDNTTNLLFWGCSWGWVSWLYGNCLHKLGCNPYENWLVKSKSNWQACGNGTYPKRFSQLETSMKSFGDFPASFYTHPQAGRSMASPYIEVPMISYQHCSHMNYLSVATEFPMISQQEKAPLFFGGPGASGAPKVPKSPGWALGRPWEHWPGHSAPSGAIHRLPLGLGGESSA